MIIYFCMSVCFFFQSFVSVSSFKLPHNGKGIAEGGDFQHKSSIEALHLNLPQNCHTKHRTRHYAKPLLWAGLFRLLSATFLVLLNWRTFYTSVTAINTTVALLWFKNMFALFTFVKILASVCRHCFFFLMSAVGASYC